MASEKYLKIKEIFFEAVELSPGELENFLDRKCTDVDLRREVELLLKAHEQGKDFLKDVSALDVVQDSYQKSEAEKHIGRLIDKYRIIRELGRGGMGLVFLAERDDFHQQVALKLIKRGMDSDAIIERFRREREILASLNHPNIARFLDGGTTDEDTPFFVMEYVEGVSIDEYCHRQNLSEAAKLELFRKVCAAVSFAHQKLIVHRDLKPSNILITDEGEPKLLDFGIAKLLDDTRGDQTQTNQRVLTPAYASPEQMRGEPVDTTSDVYSLGKILTEILKPGDKETHSQQTKTGKSTVNTDLQAIMETSLREETTRRYNSVERFSDDIRRYLSGLPISAQKDTFTYRARKFVQRNYISVTISALFILTLLSGLTVVIWQSQRVRSEHAKAEQRFNDVQELANSFMFEFHDAIENLPGSTPARQLVVNRALKYLNKLADESGDDVALQRELATAYERIGKIQGNSYYSNLGDTSGGMESYQRSLEIRQKLIAADADNIELQDELANSFEGVGDMFYTLGDLKSGLSNYQNARVIREKLAQTAPNNLQYQDSLAKIYGRMGDISGVDGYPNLGDTKGALENYEKAVQVAEKLLRGEPDNRELQHSYASKLTILGMLYRTVGKTAEAVNSCQKAENLFNQLLAAEPENTSYKFDALTNNTALRYALSDDGRVDEAIELSRQTISLTSEMQAKDPKNDLLQRSLGIAYNMLSRSLLQKGDFAGAVKNARSGLEIAEALSAKDEKNVEEKADLAHTLQFLAEAQFAAHDYDAALANYRRALSINQKNLELDSANARTRDDVSICLAELADVLAAKGDFKEALKDFQEAIPIAEKDVEESPSSAVIRSRLALRYFEIGKSYEALAKSDAANRVENQKNAKNWYQKGFDIWSEMQRNGILSKVDDEKLQSASNSLNRLNG